MVRVCYCNPDPIQIYNILFKDTMTPEEFIKMLQENATEVQEFLDNMWPYIAGDTAVNHFKENFDHEGFMDGGVTPWDDVKRRDNDSEWYGIAPNNKGRLSSTRAADPILKDTNELRDAIDYEVRGAGEVVIVNEKPYAAVHNEGGHAFVFGKTPFEMPKRQFIGDSEELNEKNIDELTNELDNIIQP